LKPSLSVPEFTLNFGEKGNKTAGDLFEEYNYSVILFHYYSIIMKQNCD